jgi:hypothetical protein
MLSIIFKSSTDLGELIKVRIVSANSSASIGSICASRVFTADAVQAV